MSDILCLYYSRSGNTRQTMAEIAEALEAELVEFTDGVGRGKSWTVDVRNGVLHAHEEKETEKSGAGSVRSLPG